MNPSKDEIDSAISEVISKSAFIGGPFVESFEKAFASFCNVKHCIGVGNGTDALFIALKTLGIGPGDEVIVPANSFHCDLRSSYHDRRKSCFCRYQSYKPITWTPISSKIT